MEDDGSIIAQLEHRGLIHSIFRGEFFRVVESHRHAGWAEIPLAVSMVCVRSSLPKPHLHRRRYTLSLLRRLPSGGFFFKPTRVWDRRHTQRRAQCGVAPAGGLGRRVILVAALRCHRGRIPWKSEFALGLL